MSNSDQNDSAINRAFTAQSNHYDADDFHNPILQAWRRQIYKHVDAYLRPASNLLELNAGTGIDALHFAHAGHNVLATDISDGMILQLRNKVEKEGPVSLRVKQLSFTNLSMLKGELFDYVFSNFGGGDTGRFFPCEKSRKCFPRSRS